MSEEKEKPTICYSYEVTMVVQIMAESEEAAKEKLDKDGGFVSKRAVVLKDAVPLYSGEEK
jgi:hypothetical protein